MLLSSLAKLIEEINEKALPFRIGKVDKWLLGKWVTFDRVCIGDGLIDVLNIVNWR